MQLKSLFMVALVVAGSVALAFAGPPAEKKTDFDRMVERANRAETMTATAADGTRFEVKPAVANWREFYPSEHDGD